MQFKERAKVFSADNQMVGTLKRVVLEPDTKKVSHLVVEKGFLFTKDKVIPTSLVGPATDDRVTLRKAGDDLDMFPDFEETYYISVTDGDKLDTVVDPGISSMYWYPPIGFHWASGIYAGYPHPRYVVKTEKNIPQGTVALEEGAKVDWY